ncbi:helix-turn-helix domain-containing protein [Paenibacillus sp. FSL R7-0337]|uniref:helix-turn-helix domain-containing protein n=1 Tax=Paenibacillus sp. FSL R7-0337 TaxID=1926588 RepID=UPI001C4D87AA|nr:helix-turn-helix domain-containing protein [Paenibacillus sp. FSL R7-0337]
MIKDGEHFFFFWNLRKQTFHLKQNLFELSGDHFTLLLKHFISVFATGSPSVRPMELSPFVDQLFRSLLPYGTLHLFLPSVHNGLCIDVQIVAIACEDPKVCGRPVSHWTPREVQNEAVKRGDVETISVRQVGRFLKMSRIFVPTAARDG